MTKEEKQFRKLIEIGKRYLAKLKSKAKKHDKTNK